MDIDIIESTFNELIGELGKIKDLNEVAETYKQRTQVLSDLLDHFLSVVPEERSTILKDAEDIKALVTETERKNTNSISALSSCISEAISENRQSREESQRNTIERFDSLISQVTQAQNLIEQLNDSGLEIRMKMEELFQAIHSSLSEKELYIKSRIEQNENVLRKNQKLVYAQIGLTICCTIILILIMFFK